MVKRLSLAAGFVVCAFSQPIAAQSAQHNPAAAEALYEEARTLARAERYDEACPKFRASYELDPGGGTLLNLGDCYEKQGKSASAWSTFKEALVAAQRDGRQERIDFANQHLAALEPRLVRLTVRVPASSRVPGLSVALDDATLAEAAWGVGMPVDPGTHRVRADAPGKEPFLVTVEAAAARGSRVIEIPALKPAAAAASASEPRAGAVELRNADATRDAGAARSNSRRTAGWVIGGAGVVALGVGSFFGLRAFSRWKDRDRDCVGGCSAAGKQAGDDASRAATISTVGFGVGIAAIGLGTYLVLSGGHSEAAPTAALNPARSASSNRVTILPIVEPGRTGLSLRSVW